MKKPLPVLRTDKEAEEWIANSDLTEYDLSGIKMVKFNFVPRLETKSDTLNMRLRPGLKQALKKTAARVGMPYQKFAHQMLEAGLRSFDEHRP